MSNQIHEVTLNQIVRNARDVINGDDALFAWLHRPNRRLDGRSPQNAYLDGDGEAVMRIIDHMAGEPRID